MYPSRESCPFIRHALRHGTTAERASAPYLYCEQVERLRDIGLPQHANIFDEGALARVIIESAIEIEIDPNTDPTDLHDLLVLCDDVMVEQAGRCMSTARAAIVSSYQQKIYDLRPATPMEAMLARVHNDEFIAYANEAARNHSRRSRLR